MTSSNWSLSYKINRTFELVLKSDGTVLRNRREEGERNTVLGQLTPDEVEQIKKVIDSIDVISSTRTHVGNKFLTDQETIAYTTGLQQIAWPFPKGAPPTALKPLYNVVLDTFVHWLE
eukprot:TRINITY_DN752_c2_g1_i1.p1 TRINITY_DN752_c2_g1~~TRINITY_DN752_c2_g1_i1.p1  ORF type:complete len:118 (-),score=16.34 TRINITY_DN752_c2_g1_i1:40-393(-)